MSNRIEARFAELAEQGRKGLIPFVTAGDPHPDWTVDVMHALAQAGADLIELGVPFSDPMADGPVIQQASERAIARGTTLAGVLGMVRGFREKDARTPVVLMGYLNPVERYGAARFARDAAAAGVDGLLLVDCPPEALGDLGEAMDEHGLAVICLVAPTTTEARLARIAPHARGFVYYVSFKGVTGAARLDTAQLAEPIGRIRRHVRTPVAVGFGVKDADSARGVAAHADAVVIGSALVQALAGAEARVEATRAAEAFLAPVRQALDNTPPHPG